MNAHKPTIEERLQSYLDGEVTPEERRAIEAEIARSEIHRQKLDVLRAVRDAIDDVAESDDAACPPDLVQRVTETPMALRTRVPVWALVSLPLAAAVLIAITFWRGGNKTETPDGGEKPAAAPAGEASNEWLRVVATPQRRSIRLLDDVMVDLTFESTSGLIHIGDRVTDPAAAAAQLVKTVLKPPSKGILPIAVAAEIHGPDGRVWRGPLPIPIDASEGRLALGKTSVSVALSAMLASGGERIGSNAVAEPLPPHFGLGRDASGAFVRKKHFVDVATKFVCPEPGSYRVKLLVNTLPARPEYSWPQFAESLAVEFGFDVAGHVGAWSDPVDGLRVRLATPAKTLAHPAPIAIQIENVGQTPKRYNYMGVTMAKIPQPYHFNLRLGDRELEQKDVGIVIPAMSSFQTHSGGVIRTVVVSAAFWDVDGTRLSRVAGDHRLSVRYHFKPTLWKSEDTTIWMGEMTSPPIVVTIAALRDRR